MGGWVPAEARLLVPLPCSEQTASSKNLSEKSHQCSAFCWETGSVLAGLLQRTEGHFSKFLLVPLLRAPGSALHTPSPSTGLAAAVLHFVTCSDWAGWCCLQSSIHLVCLTSLAHCPNHVAWWCPAYLNKVIHIQHSSLLASSSHSYNFKEVICVLLPVQNCC